MYQVKSAVSLPSADPWISGAQGWWPHLCLFQATRQFLEEINKWTSQHGVSPLSRELAVKFLMARKFDVLRAIELFHSYRVRGDRRIIHWSWLLAAAFLGSALEQVKTYLAVWAEVFALLWHHRPFRGDKHRYGKKLFNMLVVFVKAQSKMALFKSIIKHVVWPLSVPERIHTHTTNTFLFEQSWRNHGQK